MHMILNRIRCSALRHTGLSHRRDLPGLYSTGLVHYDFVGYFSVMRRNANDRLNCNSRVVNERERW